MISLFDKPVSQPRVGTQKEKIKPKLSTRFGYKDTSHCSEFKPTKLRGKYALLKPRFVKRLKLLQYMISRMDFEYNIRCYDMRNSSKCRFCSECMLTHSGHEREFRYRTYTWPEAYLHLIDNHNLRPHKVFYKLVVRLTQKHLPLTSIEKTV
jgi:hypothetical protein